MTFVLSRISFVFASLLYGFISNFFFISFTGECRMSAKTLSQVTPIVTLTVPELSNIVETASSKAMSRFADDFQQPKAPTDDHLITKTEAGEILGVSRQSLATILEEIPAVPLHGLTSLRYRRGDVLDYIKRQKEKYAKDNK
jgi:hypothetical protein